MEKEIHDALTLLLEKIDKHVRHATYQEDTKEAYALVREWLEVLPVTA